MAENDLVGSGEYEQEKRKANAKGSSIVVTTQASHTIYQR
jgi:hypothetical protein